jgi:hypothetical protein
MYFDVYITLLSIITSHIQFTILCHFTDLAHGRRDGPPPSFPGMPELERFPPLTHSFTLHHDYSRESRPTAGLPRVQIPVPKCLSRSHCSGSVLGSVSLVKRSLYRVA